MAKKRKRRITSTGKRHIKGLGWKSAMPMGRPLKMVKDKTKTVLKKSPFDLKGYKK